MTWKRIWKMKWKLEKGVVKKKMEPTKVYWGYIGDNGKEHGNYHNGKIGYIVGLIRVL